MYFRTYKDILFKKELKSVNKEKLLINTLNAYSFVTAAKNKLFQDALIKSDLLLPDGISIVLAMRLLEGKKLNKVAGYDLFIWEMERLKKINGKCFFLGSSEETLKRISDRCKIEYPTVKVDFYSPPYKNSFNGKDTEGMIGAVNKFSPDVLFVGMTAPKQEIWAAQNYHRLEAKHVCCIGAVFDMYSGNVKRAPKWMIKIGLEWFYRLVIEPKRLGKRYLLGNFRFVSLILKEKMKLQDSSSYDINTIKVKVIDKQETVK